MRIIKKIPFTKEIIRDFCNSKPVIRYFEPFKHYLGIANTIRVFDEDGPIILEVIFEWDIEMCAHLQEENKTDISYAPKIGTLCQGRVVELYDPVIEKVDDILSIKCSDGKKLHITHLITEKHYALKIKNGKSKTLR